MAVNIHGIVFTLARLKIVPTIKNLICRCLLYDYKMSCRQELYVHRDSSLVLVVGL